MPWTLQFTGFGAARQWVGNVPLTITNQPFIFVFENSLYQAVRLFGVAAWRVTEDAPANFAPTVRQSIQVWNNPQRWVVPAGEIRGSVSVYVPAETPGLREVRILRFDP